MIVYYLGAEIRLSYLRIASCTVAVFVCEDDGFASTKCAKVGIWRLTRSRERLALEGMWMIAGLEP